jgi:hypothetical protein
MRCHTQQDIADAVGVDVATVNRKIADFLQNGQMSEMQNFRNFEPQACLDKLNSVNTITSWPIKPKSSI